MSIVSIVVYFQHLIDHHGRTEQKKCENTGIFH